MMWPYLLVFFAALAVDTIPVFAPPAWILLVVLLVKFKLNPWLTVIIGVIDRPSDATFSPATSQKSHLV
jgi:hypothetical protein